MKLQRKPARKAAMTKQKAESTIVEPTSQRRGHSAAITHHALDPSEECAGIVERIGVRHGVAARQKTAGSGTGNKAMHVEPAISRGKDDFATTNVSERAGDNLNDVAGPKRGKHAITADSQAQAAGVTQSVYC
jgi:hypothetical protein